MLKELKMYNITFASPYCASYLYPGFSDVHATSTSCPVTLTFSLVTLISFHVISASPGPCSCLETSVLCGLDSVIFEIVILSEI